MSLFSRDGMLTGTEIERRVRKGHIQISPYDPKCVNPNSYNLKLHPQLLIYKRDAERANILPHTSMMLENEATYEDIAVMQKDGIECITSDISTISYEDNQAKSNDTNIDEDIKDNEKSKSHYGVEIITGNTIKMAIADKVDSAVETLTESMDKRVEELETKWSDKFDQLNSAVELNKYESDKRLNDIENTPIVESNYLPPLDMHKKNETIEFQIPEEGYVLQPGVLYIGRTVERTATDRFIPMINGRSSGGRLGISIHICAGFGDIGFDGTWTLEITVVEPVRIYPYEEIAQVCFFTPAGKKAKLYRGRYYKQEEATASRFHQPKKEY